MIFANEIDI